MDERDYIALNKDLNKMKLKEQTFAVLADKPNSIAHNWFQQAFSQAIEWVPGNWYIFDPKAGMVVDCPISKAPCEITYLEIEFEKRLEQEKLPVKLTPEQLQNISNDAAADSTASMREIVEKFNVSEIKFPTAILKNSDTSIKMPELFKGFTLTKSEAEKILRDKFKLPDYVDFKIVE